MLSHEVSYNMKYILKDKKILLNIYKVHEFLDSLPSRNIEKRLKSLPGEDIIEIPHRMMYNCNDERRCKNEQSERD